MKAERRHELKTNTLALAMQRLPELWHKYGSRIVTVLLVVAVVLLLVQWRVRTVREQARIVEENLSAATLLVADLRQFDFWQFGLEPQQMAGAGRDTADQANMAIDQVLRTSDDPRVRAEALVARGDLNWLLANMPSLPGAEEQEELQFHPGRTREELLAEAEQTYRQVLEEYGEQQLAAVTARFGLAAIAENRQEWEVARQHYEQIAEDESLMEAFRQQARLRNQVLDQIRQPVYIGRAAVQPMIPELGMFDPPAIQPMPPMQPTEPTEPQAAMPGLLGPFIESDQPARENELDTVLRLTPHEPAP